VSESCPFCTLDPSEILASNGSAHAFFDAYPVSPGHVLVITKRHVGTWFEATAAERLDLFELVDRAKELLSERHGPDGYNLGINVGSSAGQTVPHLHVHVIPRYDGDVDDPTGGVRHVVPELGNYRRPGHIPRLTATAETRAAPLSTGGRADPFLAHLKPLFAEATEISILAAFVQNSGVERLREPLLAAVARGARVRVLTGDYLHITQARALRGLLDLQEGESLTEESGAEDSSEEQPSRQGSLELRVVESERLRPEASTFHPKSWIFVGPAAGDAFVGSSNLSWAALTDGLEWNLRVERRRDPEAFSKVIAAFEETWGRGRPVDQAWLDAYGERAAAIQRPLPGWDVEEQDTEPPTPRDVQVEALARLRRARVEEHRDRAVVVLATGLGKTWLAAFDVQQFAEELGRSPRVLFLAHRVELLRQAARTFRRLFPDQRFGWYAGGSNDLVGDVVFASVMKLGRSHKGEATNLAKLDPSSFDYVVVDEVHHADANTYRRVLGHLQPGFRLGLTATPERADAGDVLGLFDDFVAFEAGIGEGITQEHLVPFRYFGLKDVVDYAPTAIPWRNKRFDPKELGKAVQTQARMETLWEGWQKHPGTRTLIFCCSIQHAEFVKGWLGDKGISIRAAHSGPTADDRVEALEALTAGDVQAVCAVDLFNEGIDLPLIDRVVMLRPTESPVIFLQQLGRGLRCAEGKEYLTVIDFVGNHRVFLDRVRTLLTLASSSAPSLREFLEESGQAELPDGCSIDVELEALDLLRKLLPSGAKQLAVRAYRDLRETRGKRPTIGEVYRLGYNPASLKAHDGWFDFVSEEGDLREGEEGALEEAGDFLRGVERRESMNKCFKMVALQALLEADSLWDGLSVSEVAERSLAILRRSPELLTDVSSKALGNLDDLTPEKWTAYWRKWPLARWAGEGRKKGAKAWFRLEGDRFEPRFEVGASSRQAVSAMLREVVDYRLARYRRSRAIQPADAASSFECKLLSNASGPIIKLPNRSKTLGVPREETDVRLPDGSVWQFRFKKEFCNVARPVGKQRNELADLLRRWFGPDAGKPGSAFYVRFSRSPDGWWIEPADKPLGKVVPFPSRGRLTSFPTLRAAAGWAVGPGTVGEGLEAEEVSLPGDFDRESSFVVRASGSSMAGWKSEILDGDWLVLRWARQAGLSEVMNRVALVARGDPAEGLSYHLKRVRKVDGEVLLASDNPAFPPLPAAAGDEVVALLTQAIRPESLAPTAGTRVEDVATVFGLSASPTGTSSRVDGHLFLLLEGKGALCAPERVAHHGAAPRPGETAFVLARAAEGESWFYLGLGRWLTEESLWSIPEVDFAQWRALGQGRSASRELPQKWEEKARDVAANLASEPVPRLVEARGRSCRLLGRAKRGGLRIDGGPDGFKARTVSLADLGWVLLAQEANAERSLVDETLVNRVRYLSGTPKGSTRWIDSQWALVLLESTSQSS
jgi:superfamily II DNA or RNA helicase/diadenosine tetraphosphate (Ap4A) HIT family hydrolase